MAPTFNPAAPFSPDNVLFVLLALTASAVLGVWFTTEYPDDGGTEHHYNGKFFGYWAVGWMTILVSSPWWANISPSTICKITLAVSGISGTLVLNQMLNAPRDETGHLKINVAGTSPLSVVCFSSVCFLLSAVAVRGWLWAALTPDFGVLVVFLSYFPYGSMLAYDANYYLGPNSQIPHWQYPLDMGGRLYAHYLGIVMMCIVIIPYLKYVFPDVEVDRLAFCKLYMVLILISIICEVWPDHVDETSINHDTQKHMWPQLAEGQNFWMIDSSIDIQTLIMLGIIVYKAGRGGTDASKASVGMI